MHNMIVEDERHLYLCADNFNYEQFDGIQPKPISHHRTPQLIELILLPKYQPKRGGDLG